MSENKFMPIAVKIAELVQEKNTAYGDAAGKSVEYLKLLYPNGVRPEQYQNMLLLVRDFDKNMRIATDEDALGESPWGDKAGYAILALELRGRVTNVERTNPVQVKNCGNCANNNHIIYGNKWCCFDKEKQKLCKASDLCFWEKNKPKQAEEQVKSCETCTLNSQFHPDKCGCVDPRVREYCPKHDFCCYIPNDNDRIRPEVTD